MSAYIIRNGELYHHGVKGMKWGVRRKKKTLGITSAPKGGGNTWDEREHKNPYENQNNSLKSAKKNIGKIASGAKRSHNADYSDKQRKRDRAFYGNRGEKRINKKMNEGYGVQGARHFEAERKERKEQMTRAIKRGTKKVSKAISTIGMAYIYDQAFNDGRGTRAVGKAVKQAGRIAVSAYTKARGGYDIHWYDN